MTITNLELEIIKLIDIKKYSISRCSEELKISKKEVKKNLNSVREKIVNGLLNEESFEIEKLEIKEEEKEENICKFRCSVCGKIYSVNYKNGSIICPLCFSSKVMDKKTANI